MLSKEEIEKAKEDFDFFHEGDYITKEMSNCKEKIFEYIEQLEKENINLRQVSEVGLNKEKQYCFNEDGKTGLCLGYSSYNDDEPCDYCKSCEKINVKE